MKDIEGIYKVKVLGPYGWENFSTAFIRDGEYLSGSDKHFTGGHYHVNKDNFEMEGCITQYVKHRPLFGQTKIKDLPIKFRGNIQQDMIDGEAKVTGKNPYSVRFRLDRMQ